MDIINGVTKVLVEDTKRDKFLKLVLGTAAGFITKQLVEDGYDKFIKNRRNT